MEIAEVKRVDREPVVVVVVGRVDGSVAESACDCDSVDLEELSRLAGGRAGADSPMWDERPEPCPVIAVG